MTLTILGIVAALIPIIWNLYQKRAAKKADPLEQNREAHKQIEKPVNAPSVALSDSLDEFERLRNANRKQ